ncbi:hypothetical protein OG444_36115 [Streptomyces sp. NBC_01232]|uniref:hypothetical protein n=1 Tax=unclassified Streptomyces TaxID=2593676 RepID=UPI002E12F3A6|nr:hypothetical protein OG444_36115 [Streptomyces sp. NBC_01232]
MAAMVGLFWVTPDAVYVGSPPNAIGVCVRLTADGLEAADPDGSLTWTWQGVRSAVVEDAPSESRTSRASKLLGSVVSAAIGGLTGEGPPEMTLRLDTADGSQRLTVYSAAAGGYIDEEVRLSQELLDRFVAGTADPRAPGAWGRVHAGEGTPEPRAREALLRAWAQT